MKKRLSEENKQNIRKLYEEGWNVYLISRKLGVSQNAIYYWLKNREKQIQSAVERYRNYSPHRKKQIYEKNKRYYAEYFKRRYWEDEEFREKVKKLNRERKRKGL